MLRFSILYRLTCVACQSVVSALVEPDTVVVGRSWDDRSLAVQEVKLGSKQGGIVLGPGQYYIVHYVIKIKTSTKILDKRIEHIYESGCSLRATGGCSNFLCCIFQSPPGYFFIFFSFIFFTTTPFFDVKTLIFFY